MSASLSSNLTSASVVSMEVAAPVIVASPEVEKKGAKRARKEAPPAVASEAASEAPAAVPRSRKKAVSPQPAAAEGEAPAADSEGAACEASAGEGEKKDSSGSLIVAKAIRVLLKSHSTPIHLGSDALPALNAKVTEMIYEAIGRALANGRKTLKNSDF